MNPGLRAYLDHLEKDMPSHVLRVRREVSPAFEIPAILHKVEARKKQPVMIFEKVRALDGRLSELPVVINLFGSRERMADAIGSTVPRLPLDYIAREKPVPSRVVDRSRASVKDVVQRGEAVNLFELPIITHHEFDQGPYLTSSSAWVKDPETGWVNCAILRFHVPDPRHIVVNFSAVRHTNHVFQKYKKQNRNVPMVIVIGHHPAFYMGAQTKVFAHEPDIIGGVMGEPLELTASETWGEEMLVPAEAEIVIEGELSTSERQLEGPFGEYTQYYGGQTMNPICTVTAVTRRRDALYLDIMPGHADHLLLDAPMMEAYLYDRIRAVVPGVRAVHMPVSGTARLHAYVQIAKTSEGEPRTAIATALSSDYRLKHVIVVDEDVDVYDDEQVLWAVATRSQWDRDLLVLPGMMGTKLDPSGGLVTTKAGIDATKPCGDTSFPRRLNIPESVLARISLDDVLDPDTLRHL